MGPQNLEIRGSKKIRNALFNDCNEFPTDQQSGWKQPYKVKYVKNKKINKNLTTNPRGSTLNQNRNPHVGKNQGQL